MTPGGRVYVAVPQGRSPAEQRAVPLQTHIEVVEQRFDRADVQDTEPRPPLGKHAGGERQEGRLGLSAGRGASTIMCWPARIGGITPSWNGRNSPQPKLLTTWCWTCPFRKRA